MKIRFSLMLAGSVVFLGSCLEELQNTDKIVTPELKPRFEAPVAYSSFTIGEFLEKGESTGSVQQQGNDLVLVYEKDLFTEQASSVFDVPDQTIPTVSLGGPDFPILTPGGSFTVTKNATYTMSTSGEKLDSIIISNAALQVDINSDVQANISLSITFPTLIRNGSPVTSTFSYTYPGSGSANWNTTKTLPLDLSHLDLTNNGTSFNTLPYNISAVVTDNGGVLFASSAIHVDMKITGVTFGALFGELGNKTFNSKPDTINIDILDNAIAGTFKPAGAKISLLFDNELGASIGVDLGSLGAITTSGVTMLSGSAFNAPQNPHEIDGPELDMVGQGVTSTIEITSANSNFLDILNDLPSYLFYEFQGTLNPNGTNVKNFVLDSSKVAIGFRAEVPLSGIVNNLVVRKKFNFDGINLDELKDFSIHQVTENGFPIDIHAQAYFSDENGVVTDSLYKDEDLTFIKSAPVDSNGASTGITTLDRDVALTQEQIDHLRDARFMQLVVIINGASASSPVKIQADDLLTIRLGIKGSVGYKIE